VGSSILCGAPRGVPTRIIALLATARDGQISGIVPRLKEGAGVVTTRADVHYVVTVRFAQPTKGLLRELFYSHSPETILYRSFTALKHLSHEQVQRFVTLNYKDEMAIIGLVPFEGQQKMIAVARYFRDPATNTAEVAVTIHDEFRRRGIGSYLLREVAKIALEHGIGAFIADVLPDNAGMMRLFQKISRKVEVERHEGINQVKVLLSGKAWTAEGV
jgi:RimJ/RimL family protein N-acetyltransferase